MYKSHKKVLIIFTILFLSFSLMSHINLINESKKNKYSSTDKIMRNSAEESYSTQLLKNSEFDSNDYWYDESAGDTTDVNSSFENNQANLMILGDQNETIVNNETYPLHPENWKVIENTDDMSKPDSWGVSKYGLWASHAWEEDENQSVKVQWACNISTPVNMTDYEISSVNLSAFINATVDDNIDVPGDSVGYAAAYDYMRFFILVSDLERNQIYEIGYNQTRNLGEDGTTKDYLYDTKLTNIPKERIINYLTDVLSYDGFNFSLTLGIRYWCEDNRATDYDNWDIARFKNVTLEFNYKKKINQFTSQSWNQNITEINSLKNNINDTINIDNCYLSLDYNISDAWGNESRNSEIQILFNGIFYSKTIKLTEINSSLSNIQFDITKLISNIPFNERIDISIRLFIADNFQLNKVYHISLDNIFLDLKYTLNFDDYQSNLYILLDGVNKTYDPYEELIVNERLNITVNYVDKKEKHLTNADVFLKFGDRSFLLIENKTLNHYSLIINNSKIFNYGTNILELEANVANYERKIANIKVELRRINVSVSSTFKTSQIKLEPGQDVNFSIRLENVDYGGNIRNATVTYEWDKGTGVLIDTNNDGLYEAYIENIPEGTFKIKINAFISDEYSVEEYEITLTAVTTEIPDLTGIIFILLASLVIVLGSMILYQKYFKYPPVIRKLRKLRKNIKSDKKLKKFDLKQREEKIKKLVQSNSKDVMNSQKNSETIISKKNKQRGINFD